MTYIEIKYSDGVEPIKAAHEGEWIDLRAAEDVEMKAGEYKKISLGVAMKLPAGVEAHILPRSSTFERFGIIQSNGMGVIDNLYCGNNDIWSFPAIALRDTHIFKNDRICQFRLVGQQGRIFFKRVYNLSDENRGGYGSSGYR